MILREICTEALSMWEECFIATCYLNGLEMMNAALEEPRRARVCHCLTVLRDLPLSFARELCLEVLRHAETKDSEFRLYKEDSTRVDPA